MECTTAHDLNVVAKWLAQSAGDPAIEAQTGHTAIILVGSAILPTMRAVFDYLSDIAITSPITLMLCGGIGHSTPLLRSAIVSAYSGIKSSEVEGLPEAGIFETAMRLNWPELCRRVDRGEIGYLVEEESTNCGANASLAVETMLKAGIAPDRLIVVQDPTMMRRTIASFEKAYTTLGLSATPAITSWSTFTPQLTCHDDEARWNITDFSDKSASVDELWTTDRFVGLLVGEIARLNDDEEGYGPKGKGFIGHVDIPEDVMASWKRLKVIGAGREAQN